LSDWPIAYRRISFAYDEQLQRIKVRGELMPHIGAPITSDQDLLLAWEAITCAQAGVAGAELRRLDQALVAEQREARGSLFGWLVAGLGPMCATCEDILYEHGQRYQNELLEALLQLDHDLGRATSRLHLVPVPAFCMADDAVACAQRLIAEDAQGAASQADLFRRKAIMVDRLASHLDHLRDPAAKAYMTCRAVHGAHADFEATPDDRNNNRGEAKRRAENFFLIEATVGRD
jgi:hypothetical protein